MHLKIARPTTSSLLALLRQLPILSVALALQSCVLTAAVNDNKGQLTGVSGRPTWYMEAPMGMVPIPAGSFMMGAVDDDIAGRIASNKKVTVSAYYMDATPVTNNQYRQFIEDMLDRVAEGDYGRLEEIMEDMDEDYILTHLYPDASVWQRDFTHHMSDVWVSSYYEHTAFDHYPVVGVSWEAAQYFAKWRSAYLNEYREAKGLPDYPEFSLPSVAQWEYAARGGKELTKYPWGGPYVRTHDGVLRANFKSDTGTFTEDGAGPYTSPVYTYPPNDYGLYDMAGNVAEWTLDAYNPAYMARIWDLNPVYLDDEEPMKTIKGGSWKDSSRFLQTGANDYEHKDATRSYIGFRCVIPHIGRQ
ncbi:MAG: SUMF1/EgtB/PvdO family nonheme iron enzyme [Bacteroidota bacterium]